MDTSTPSLDLMEFVEQNILPRYNNFDLAHNIRHANMVRTRWHLPKSPEQTSIWFTPLPPIMILALTDHAPCITLQAEKSCLPTAD